MCAPKLAAIAALLALFLLTPGRFYTQAACPSPRLAIGNIAIVEFKPFVELRSEPEGGQLLARINSYTVLDGPICTARGTLWWKAQSQSGMVGYAPEGQGTTYWVYPQPGKVPVTTFAAFQPFENGYMLWRYDAGSVEVFYGKNGGGGNDFATYRNRYYAALRNNPITALPPAGLIKPINGFGKVWGNFASVRQRLGWAIGPEQSYMMTISPPEPTGVTQCRTLPDGRSICIHMYLVIYWYFR
jgi:hypothetical protein